MKIQTRIAVLFAALAAAVVLVMGGLVYYFANQNAFEDFYKRLEIRAIVAAKAALEKDETNVEAYDEIRQLHLERLPHEEEYFIPVEHINDYRQYMPGADVPVTYIQQINREGSKTYKNDETFFYGLKYEDNEGRYLIIISARNEITTEVLANLRKTLLICIIVAVLLSSFMGLWFSHQIFKPIRAITKRVQTISAHNMHLRLDSGSGKDEITQLSQTFNNMLDRLETAFETQNNFVSNASHELNTPLTTIIGETEYLLSKPRETEQYVRSLAVINSEAERLHSIIKSLLHLAQTGFNGKVQQFVRIRMDEMLFTVKKTVDNIFPDNKVYINHSLMPEDEKKLIVSGNPQLLELALVNVVLNGYKYSSNQPVQVAIAATNDKIIILVKDVGIGIPREEIKYVFEPFFRASNTQDFQGYGIGLPLSRNIVRMHKGDLIVDSEQGQGTEIKIILPMA